MNSYCRLSNSLAMRTVSGLVATGPMTVVMMACKQMLPEEHRYKLPPEQIMERRCRFGASSKGIGSPAEGSIVWAAHYGYGSLMGLIYGH
jgi:hypothetical protein